MALKSLISSLVLAALLAACAPAPTAMPAPPTLRPEQENLLPQSLPSPTQDPNQPTPTVTATETAAPFVLNLTPVPTETPLPTLEVPTEVARPPELQIWDGLPTYLADSQPGYDFRVRFNPTTWALTFDNYGSPALVHRAITNCIVSPSAGRGLPPNATVDQEIRRINGIQYQISTASVGGVKQFVTYSGGDGRIFTGFDVSLQDSPDQCISDAETVLGTLTSVPTSQATPIATP